tara:strand:- start:3517 stop:5181 length:1665 start_codon:yes stop_codon:yes gene_type:complete
MLTVYIGWDSRETIAADVCRHSILKHTSIPVDIVMLKQEELRRRKLYWRDVDKLASTEFTFTRFLVPYLNNYEGTAIFMDSDMVLTTDIAELIADVDPKKAISCVQHDYTPPPGFKMDGQQQLAYPRKNWSSMVVWNCAHPANKQVTLELVNDPEVTGAYLHRFSWLKDHYIGLLGPQWNWLVDWYVEGRDGAPLLLHYTEGGPWFSNHKNCGYSDVWNWYHDSFKSTIPEPIVSVKALTLNRNLKTKIHNILESAKDPYRIYYEKHTKDYVKELLQQFENPKVVGVVDSGVVAKEDQVKKEPKKDAILDNFLTGAQGVFAGSKNVTNLDLQTPIVVRGIAKRKIMHQAIEDGRDFYYIDTGYFGNAKTKKYHRISKNSLQFNLPVDDNCPDDRLLKTGVTIKRKTPGKNILLCPPSQKALAYWAIDLKEWIETTTQEIARHTDRPIIIREKQNRGIRTHEDTIEMALSRDVHCMVTYNSIAAVESLILGKPVFTMGPNAAEPLSNTDLERIDNPMIPTVDRIRQFCCNLAYAQFTPEEMVNGTAWRILQERYN